MRSSGRWEFIVKNKRLLPKPVYLTFESEQAGIDYCARLEALLKKGIVPPELIEQRPATFTSVADLIDDYNDKVAVPQSERNVLRPLREKFAEKPVAECSYAWAESWVTTMKRVDRLAPVTIRHRVGALARCFDWAQRKDTRTFPGGNPLRLLPKRYASYNAADGEKREDVERDRRLEAGEDERIMAKMPDPDLKLLYVMLRETAMRLREAYTLTMAQIDIEKRTIFLEKTKNGSKRQVPMSSVVVDALWGRKELPVWWDGEQTLESVTASLSRRFANVFKAAGCKDLHTHDLRHHATCQFFLRTDMSDLEISLVTGHTNPRMLRRYASLRGSELAGRLW